MSKRPTKKRTQEIHEMLLREQNAECFWCGVTMNDGTLDNRATIDHVVPLCRGGRDIEENRVLACHLCNGVKGGKSVAHWEAMIRAARSGSLEHLTRLHAYCPDTMLEYGVINADDYAMAWVSMAEAK